MSPNSIKYYLVVVMSVVLSITSMESCQKAPINGDLDGQWQVASVTPRPSQIIVNERLYYNFGMHVCMLTYYEGWFLSANMEYDGKTMRLDFPYASSEEDYIILRQYGITENPVAFNLRFEGSHRLVLWNDDTEITLIKL